MKFKAFSSLIAASTILVSVLPANANPSHQSWIDSDTLATDHRAYCDDIVAADTHVNKSSYYQNDIGEYGYGSSYHNQQANSRESNTKAGGSYMGIGANVGHGSKSSSESSQQGNTSINNNWNNSYGGTSDTTQIINEKKGSNCAAFVDAAARRDMNNEQQVTNRMAIEAKERVQTKGIESQSQTDLFNTLMQGW
jgi:hypothetical protein